jgi:hypothetical protein
VRGHRYLWLLVPALGVLELVLHVWFATRAPRVEDWRDVASAVRALKRPGEPIVVAPEWAEPLARHAFGNEAFPLEELARPDDQGPRRVLEVSALGARYAGTSAFRVVSESRHGPFTLRVLENPRPASVTYRLLEHVSPGELTVTALRDGEATPCPFSDHARVHAGGLHGEVTFPRERFVCPGPPSAFVGITVIDDQRYAPRRCLWAQPPPGATLRLALAGVPFGSKLRGFAGLSYFLFRDSTAPPIELSVASEGAVLGRHLHEDAAGWAPFELATPALARHVAPLELEVRSSGSEARDFCFVLEAVK